MAAVVLFVQDAPLYEQKVGLLFHKKDFFTTLSSGLILSQFWFESKLTKPKKNASCLMLSRWREPKSFRKPNLGSGLVSLISNLFNKIKPFFGLRSTLGLRHLESVRQLTWPFCVSTPINHGATLRPRPETWVIIHYYLHFWGAKKRCKKIRKIFLMTAISSLKWKISLFLKCNPTWSKFYGKLFGRSFTCTLSLKSVDKSLQSTPKRSHLNAHFSLIGDLNGAKTQFFFFEKILRFLKQCRAETSQSDFLMAGAN